MRILHYALGFPPYRTGGLTKFCMDLMIQQKREGHEVALLWPGKMRFINKASNVSIKNRGIVSVDGWKLESFEIINPLPVPYDEGVKDIPAFLLDAGEVAYQKLLKSWAPDILHIHTFMGMHVTLLNVAKKQDVKLVFSAHDFFPICPKVTMYKRGGICVCSENYVECPQCNASALSITKIKLLQSTFYRTIKNTYIVRKLRTKHRDSYFSEEENVSKMVSKCSVEDYKILRQHYEYMLQQMDVLHFNSTVTERIYKQYFQNLPEDKIINITHSNIQDRRRKKTFTNDTLRIRYLGPQRGEKGFFVLKEACDKLWSTGRKFKLDIHFSFLSVSPYMRIHERYMYKELEDIFADTDVLVAPSLCYETFGYTVLEALSYGVPVIISGTVGAKDILAEGAGIVIDDINADKLFRALNSLNASELEKMNYIIMKNQEITTLDQMEVQIERQCY